MLDILKAFFACLIMGLLIAYILFMWATGCGERYVDSKGVLHSYECYQLSPEEMRNWHQ
jgi:hypothetical protein